MVKIEDGFDSTTSSIVPVLCYLVGALEVGGWRVESGEEIKISIIHQT